ITSTKDVLAKVLFTSIKGTCFKVDLEKNHKECTYQTDHRGYTIDKCQELRTTIHGSVNSGKISHICGPFILAYDQVKLGTPIIKDVLIHHYNFTISTESSLEVYKKTSG
ncbi:hypothetical protein H5410_035947, partial [Solanum commersonii]